MEVWINPACSKCRTAVGALDEAGTAYTQRRYLDQPPTTAELESVLARLGLEPWDIARMNEPVAKEIGLRDVPKDEGHRADWVAALVEHPKLIQRPIITLDDGTAVVARDPETLQRIIDGG
ncbi:arsenate reductase family protein [Nocardioides guangzhouensis]|uniref:Arsenate reductase family protein n=1 Tax=Nocardioides guangzhouensis TaxID=2497878 RepID=A0A4Q4ZCF0_9ACTN|nr:ArsC/Spx/MgsR family protein [Nocardioides guangzhouensis]RYP85720.1 arsenate reductase family protein [Nocardioides guangzhouensis]